MAEETVSSFDDVTTMLTSQPDAGAPAARSLIEMVTAWVDDGSRFIDEVENFNLIKWLQKKLSLQEALDLLEKH